jgi:beta-lactamase regulating signal transducer with metallopeptidase domain
MTSNWFAPLAAAGLVVLKTSILLGLGSLAGRLLPRGQPRIRHLVCLTVIVGSLLVPIVDRYVRLQVPVLPAVAYETVAVSPLASHTADVIARSQPVVDMSSDHSTSPVPRRAFHWSASTIAFAVWATIAGVLLCRLLLGVAVVRRVIRRARVVESHEWTRLLTAAAQRLNMRALPRLVMSDEVEMAFTFDPVSPVIVVPAAAAEWPADRRRAVLIHELAHVQRRDLVGHSIAAVGCAVYWFNPLAWAAAHSLRIESELASDEVVLQAGVRPSEYAQHLLDMVTNFSRRSPTLGLAMAQPHEFEGRLVAILDPAHSRKRLALPQLVAVVGTFAMIAALIGAAAPVRRVHPVAPIAIAKAPEMPTPPQAREILRDRPAVRDPMLLGRAGSAGAAGATAPLSAPAIASLLRYGTGGIVNPMLMLLRQSDSVGLSGMQADSIATLNRAYMIRLSAIWSPASAYYFANHDGADHAAAGSSVLAAPEETVGALEELLPSLRGLITPEQRVRLSPRLASYLDSAAISTLPMSPDGVFVPAGELSTIRGRGRSGG